ncbi:hypothetical protein GBZ48_22060 [Azospirillum melinis]|uniref:HTH luxR-type domain-containing protein n=1 Tax=Azospirillum melinis TaxID=328839 RepID=A0ABX2KED7_9PROT|nr:LuxR C-terminal-related transcriptional regulator [Azospirillum melinis]MBP2307493.1 FixJ family two-component response regulator [Azospirillum melinis]NUB01938.1 hypothetical protein [Azospirillum melinis]
MMGRLAQLTAREGDVLTRLVAGTSTRAIAADLGLSAKTVECHRSGSMETLGCSGLFELGRAWEAAAGSNREATATQMASGRKTAGRTMPG